MNHDVFGINFLLGILVWPFVAIWVIAMVNWMVMDDIPVLGGVTSIGLALVLAYMTWKPPMPQLSWLFFGLTAGLVLTYPMLRSIVQKNQLDRLDMEQVQRAYDMMKGQNRNPVAAMKMGKLLWEHGLPGSAVAILESSLQNQVQALFEEERAQLMAWKKHKLPPDSLRHIPCGRCHHLNPVSEPFCLRCHDEYLVRYVAPTWFASPRERMMVASWGIVCLLCLGISWGGRHLPRTEASLVAGVGLLIGAGIVIRSFVYQPK